MDKDSLTTEEVPAFSSLKGNWHVQSEAASPANGPCEHNDAPRQKVTASNALKVAVSCATEDQQVGSMTLSFLISRVYFSSQNQWKGLHQKEFKGRFRHLL